MRCLTWTFSASAPTWATSWRSRTRSKAQLNRSLRGSWARASKKIQSSPIGTASSMMKFPLSCRKWPERRHPCRRSSESLTKWLATWNKRWIDAKRRASQPSRRAKSCRACCSRRFRRCSSGQLRCSRRFRCFSLRKRALVRESRPCSKRFRRYKWRGQAFNKERWPYSKKIRSSSPKSQAFSKENRPCN